MFVAPMLKVHKYQVVLSGNGTMREGRYERWGVDVGEGTAELSLMSRASQHYPEALDSSGNRKLQQLPRVSSYQVSMSYGYPVFMSYVIHKLSYNHGYSMVIGSYVIGYS